jgi:hypothetical protein
MVTFYGSCPQTPRRSWPLPVGRSRLSKRLVGVLSELDVDRRACIASSNDEFIWMMEPLECLEE